MKKTVFDLSYEEGKKIDTELRKTSYYKQYYIVWILSIILILFGSFIFILPSLISEKPSYDLYIIISIIAICFIALLTFLLNVKRFDLVCQYYLEKEKKK